MEFKYRIALALILILSFHKDLIAQDMLFSQPGSCAIQSNSAFTGLFNTKLRAGGVYRSQYFNVPGNTDFSSKSIFFDARFNLINKDYISFGTILSDDKYAGIGRATGLINFSYAKMLNYNRYHRHNSYLIFGAQLGMGKVYNESGKYSFGIQFDKSLQVFDNKIPNGEIITNFRNYPDINAGLIYYVNRNSDNFYIGIAGSHINQANISVFQRTTSGLKIRYSFLSGGQIGMGSEIKLLPVVIFNFQSGLFNAMAGAQFGFSYDESEVNSVRFGLFLRTSESISPNKISDVIISGSFRFKKLTFGLSYDLNVSSLRRITGMNGAFEISSFYLIGENPVKNVLTCPDL
ncbi:MAG: PorP/SprF family type IX secretion system membrane protein [Deltaproteobacteria bacterium]